MSKNPAFQFYPSDWTRDLDDQDLEIEGAWIRICCRLWWSDEKGKATKSLREWSNILRTHPNKTGVILKTLLEKGIATGEYLDNQNITIISRRMVRDYEISSIRREVGKLGGNPGLMKIKDNLVNQNLSKTTGLLLQSSTSKIKTINIRKEKISFTENKFTTIPNVLMEKWREVAPGIIISNEIKKAELWLLAHPEKRRSRYEAFLSNWMVKAQADFIKYGGNGNGSTAYRTDIRGQKVPDEQANEVQRLNAAWEALKKAPRDSAGGNAKNGDVPDFQSQ